MFNTIINIIRFHYKTVVAIYVYGSYGKGLETPFSDVDICILMPEGTTIDRFSKGMDKEISLAVRKEVNCVFCTEKNEWCLKEIYNAKTDDML